MGAERKRTAEAATSRRRSRPKTARNSVARGAMEQPQVQDTQQLFKERRMRQERRRRSQKSNRDTKKPAYNDGAYEESPRSPNPTNDNLARIHYLEEQLRDAKSRAYASNWNARQRGWTNERYQAERARALKKIPELKQQIADLQ